MKTLRRLLLPAVMCSLTSMAWAQSGQPASATAIARENSIAISIAVNGKATAEAEDGAEALATAIRQAVTNDPRLSQLAKTEPAATTNSSREPSSNDKKSADSERSASSPDPAGSACKPQYLLALHLSDGRVAYVRLTREQLQRLVALKTNSAPRRVASCH